MVRGPVTTEGTLEEGYETYAGDREYLWGIWPGASINAQEHAHQLPCGGEYAHIHPQGSKPHTHKHKHRAGTQGPVCEAQ